MKDFPKNQSYRSAAEKISFAILKISMSKFAFPFVSQRSCIPACLFSILPLVSDLTEGTARRPALRALPPPFTLIHSRLCSGASQPPSPTMVLALSPARDTSDSLSPLRILPFAALFSLFFFFLAYLPQGAYLVQCSEAHFGLPLVPGATRPRARCPDLLFLVPFSRVSGEAHPCSSFPLSSAGTPAESLQALRPMKCCDRHL